MTRESAIKRSIVQFAIFYAITLLVIVREELVGAISPRALGIVGLFLMVGGCAFLTLRFRAINRSYKSVEPSAPELNNPAARRQIVRSMWMFRSLVVIMPLFLLTLSGQNEMPVLSRVVGVAVNLGFTWMFFRASRIEKTKLEKLDNALRHAEPSESHNEGKTA